MAKMTAAQAAVWVMQKEGIDQAFGVPGAAINPFYSAMQKQGTIKHILARHVEGASHMAEGYTRAKAGNIGVCLGTSGPGGTDMITGLYSAQADSIPILCITGQAPRARLHKEDFQAVDIETISKTVTKWSVMVREPALVPQVFQQAFHIMRSGRPGPVLIDLPFDVQVAEIEFDPDLYEPLPVYRPSASRKQIEAAITMLNAAERPLLISGGGVINSNATPLMLEFAEYNVITTEDGNDVRNLKGKLPDLLLLDIWMSGENGREICKKLKSSPATKKIPVIIVSAHPSAGREISFSGADDFLEKPFEMEILLGKVEKHINAAVKNP